jgi:MoaA/NifB/PqqE/SkfB family radical SAM enzyme
MDEDLRRVTRITGWLLFSKTIRSVSVRLPSGASADVSYGSQRPDVAGGVFQAYPNAGQCGFAIDLPEGALAPHAHMAFILTVKQGFGRSRRHTLPVSLSDNGIRKALPSGKGAPGKFSPATLEKRLKDSLLRKPGITLRLDIINKCNLRCIMCHYADEKVFSRPVKKLTVDQFEDFFRDLSPFVRTVVLSCADEPLVSNHFPAFLSHIAENYPHVEIEFCTNAMLMTGPVRRLIIESGVTGLMVSLDGVRKDTVERIRTGSNYERIISHVLALNHLKKTLSHPFPVLMLDFVMMTSNIHEAPAFVELAARLGARMIDFRHAVPSPVFSDPRHFLSSRPAQFNAYRERVIRAGKRFKMDIAIPPAYETRETFSPEGMTPADLSDFNRVRPDVTAGDLPVPRRFPRGFRPRRTLGTAARQFSSTFCERPFSEIAIMDQEWIKPCPWYDGHPGRLSRGRTLAEVFFGPDFRALRQRMLNAAGDDGCQACPWKTDILAGRKALYGSRARRCLHALFDPLKSLADVFR